MTFNATKSRILLSIEEEKIVIHWIEINIRKN